MLQGSLGIGIDECYLAPPCQSGCKIQGERGLAAAAFQVGESDQPTGHGLGLTLWLPSKGIDLRGKIKLFLVQ